MDIEIIGNRIAELRKARGLTQTELARRLKVSYQAVSKWENGKSLPDFGIIDSLAEELGVTMTELLGLEDKTDDEVLEEIISINTTEIKSSNTQLVVNRQIFICYNKMFLQIIKNEISIKVILQIWNLTCRIKNHKISMY